MHSIEHTSIEYEPRQYIIENYFDANLHRVVQGNPLYGKILEFYQYDFTKPINKSDKITVFPDGCLDLMFIIREGKITSEFSVGTSKISYLSEKEFPRLLIFGVRFYPGVLEEAKEFQKTFNEEPGNVAKWVYGDSLFTNIDRLSSDLFEADLFDERVKICQEYFTNYEFTNSFPSEIVQEACQYMMRKKGASIVKSLAKYLGYSQRYLRELFARYVGFSPKVLAEIIKFQESFRFYCEHPEVSLTVIANEFGYYDLAHMNRSYRNLANDCPNELHKKIINSSEKQ